jgi:hypothetical protein
MAKDLLDSRGSESQQRSNYVITCLMCATPFWSSYFFLSLWCDYSRSQATTVVAPFDSNEVDCYNNSLMQVKSILIPASSSFADSSFLRRDRSSFKRSWASSDEEPYPRPLQCWQSPSKWFDHSTYPKLLPQYLFGVKNDNCTIYMSISNTV